MPVLASLVGSYTSSGKEAAGTIDLPFSGVPSGERVAIVVDITADGSPAPTMSTANANYNPFITLAFNTAQGIEKRIAYAEYPANYAYRIEPQTGDSVTTELTVSDYVYASVFGDSGNYHYRCGNSTDKIIRQYSVDTPYDADDNPTLVNSSGTSWPGGSFPRNIFWKPDGTKVWIVESYDIHQYTPSTAWDISSITPSSPDHTFTGTYIGLDFSPDGSKFITCTYTTNSTTVYIYDLTTNWDITNRTINSAAIINGISSYGTDVKFHPDGRSFLVSAIGGLWQIDIYGLPYDTSNIAANQNKTYYRTDYVNISNMQWINSGNDLLINQFGVTSYVRKLISGTYIAPDSMPTPRFTSDTEEYCVAATCLRYTHRGVMVGYTPNNIASGTNLSNGASSSAACTTISVPIDGVALSSVGCDTVYVNGPVSGGGGLFIYNATTSGGGAGSAAQFVSYKNSPSGGSEAAGVETYTLSGSDGWVTFMSGWGFVAPSVDGQASLTSTATMAGTADVSNTQSASLTVTTTMAGTGAIVYAQTDAVEITGYRFQEWNDTEGGIPTWLSTADTALTLNCETDFSATIPNQMGGYGDTIWYPTAGYYRSVKMRMLLKNTSSVTITDWKPKVVMRLQGDTTFKESLPRFRAIDTQPRFDITPISNLDSYTVPSSSGSTANNTVSFILDPLDDEFLLVYRDSGGTPTLREYNTTTGVWDVRYNTLTTNAIWDDIHMSMIWPLSSYASLPRTYFTCDDDLFFLDNAGNLTDTGVNIQDSADTVMIRTSRGTVYRFNQYQAYMFDESTYTTGSSFDVSHSAIQYPTIPLIDDATATSFSFVSGLSTTNFFFRSVDIPYVDSGSITSRSVSTTELAYHVPIIEWIDNRISYTLCASYIDSSNNEYDNEFKLITVDVDDFLTDTGTWYTIATVSGSSFYSHLYDDISLQIQTYINGYLGGRKVSYARDFIVNASDYPLGGTNFRNFTDGWRTETGYWVPSHYPTIFNNAGNITHTATDLASVPQQSKTTTRWYGGNYRIDEFQYIDKDGYLQVVASIYGYNSSFSSNSVQVIVDTTIVAAPSATQQHLGSGTFETSNKGFMPYARSENESIVTSLAPNEEVEVVFYVNVAHDDYDEAFERGYTVEFSLEDEKGTVVTPTTIMPTLVLYRPGATLTAQADLQALASKAMLGRLDIAYHRTRLVALTNMVSDQITNDKFQVVVTQFQQEDGTESAPMLVGAPNLSLRLDTNSAAEQYYAWATPDAAILFRARWLIRNNSGATKLFNPKIQYSLNGGTWTDLTSYGGYQGHTYYSCWSGWPYNDTSATHTSNISIGREVGSANYTPTYVLMGVLPCNDGRYRFLQGYQYALEYSASQNDGNFSIIEVNASTGVATNIENEIVTNYWGGSSKLASLSPERFFYAIDSASNDMFFMCSHTDTTTEAQMAVWDEGTTTMSNVTGHGFDGSSHVTYATMEDCHAFYYNSQPYLIGRNKNQGWNITVMVFSGGTWGVVGGNAGINTNILAIVYHKSASRLRLLIRGDTDVVGDYFRKIDFNLATSTWSSITDTTFYQEYVSGSYSNAPCQTIIEEPSGQKPSAYLTMMRVSSFSRLVEYNTTNDDWSYHNYEILGQSGALYGAGVQWWDNDDNFYYRASYYINKSQWDPTSNNYHSNLGYSQPSLFYFNNFGSYYYLTDKAFIYRPTGETKPVFYFPKGYFDYSGFIGEQTLKSSQLEYDDLHHTDTTAQISTGGYTYLSTNGAFVNRSTGISSELSIPNDNEVEVVYSLHFNKTDADALTANQNVRFRLENINTAYPLDNRDHYPTINFINNAWHIVDSAMAVTATMSSTAEVSTTGDVIAYAVLTATASCSGTATVEAGFLTASLTLEFVEGYEGQDHLPGYTQVSASSQLLASATVV